MKVIFTCAFLAVLVSTQCRAEKQRFENHKVLSIRAQNEEQLVALAKLEADSVGEYEFWTDLGLKRPIDIAIPPHMLDEFQQKMVELNLDVKVKIENLQELIDLESPPFAPRVDFGWTSYHDFDEIYAFLDDLLLAYPDVLTPYIVGTSHEGRLIRAVKLSRRAGNNAVLIESNIHAREWITSATSTYILNELLTSEDPVIRELSTVVDWFFIPVFNPDGFVYSKTTNRLWRKTRFPHARICYGVDLNRNFDFHWMSVGASDNPCSETHAGPTAFSDPESRALRNFYLEHQDVIKVFLAFHSYGQYVLSPYGYTRDRADNYADLMQIGKAAADAIIVRYGTNYTVGSTAEVLYYNSGSSRDYLKGVHQVNVSYTIEFRDNGTYGFVLPPEQILPNALEMFDGIQAIINECLTLGYFS